MTKVQVYFLAACVIATPHLNEWLALGLAVIAGYLAWRAINHGD